jgi:hypothetical protein
MMCKLFKHEQQETHLDTKNEIKLNFGFCKCGSDNQVLSRLNALLKKSEKPHRTLQSVARLCSQYDASLRFLHCFPIENQKP